MTLASLGLAGCGAVVAESRFGIADAGAARLIERANRLAALRTAGRYEELAGALEADLSRQASDPYVASRLRNELAELYSHQLLDIERAIRVDEALLAAAIPTEDTQRSLVPTTNAAEQRILADARYVAEYLRVDPAMVKQRAQQRLRVNRALLQGEAPRPERRYEVAFLGRHLATVVNDLSSTHAGTPERRTVLTRRVRAELELVRLQPATKLAAHEAFLSGELTPRSADLAEIDYLSLAEYLLRAARTTGRVELAEMSLEIVYRPYSRLQDSGARWRYNRIVNDTIAALAEMHHAAGRHDEVLYYTSLNKSRLLLEERLALSTSGRQMESMSSASADDGIPRTAAGLPQRTWFKQQLAATPALLDFYLAGRPAGPQQAEPAPAATPAASRRVARNAATGPLLTRDFGLEETSVGPSQAVTSGQVMYITRVAGGRVVAAQRLSEVDVGRLQEHVEELYAAVSSPRVRAEVTPDPVFRRLREDLRELKSVVVSPDKWLAKLPFDALLDKPTTRAVNAFMATSSAPLQRLSVAGYFNPTLDLPGAEREADAIARAVPAARVLKREAATLASLSGARDVNIVHLSMHGSFDADDPRNSKLYFAGSRRPVGSAAGAGGGDPSALYARDMASHPALQRKDLVFAAACQTGLSGTSHANDAELLGILRPLTAAGNRHVILSLWNVDDEATQTFVAAFYGHLASGREVAPAFHAAQAELRRRRPQPYYWAAFYLAQSR